MKKTLLSIITLILVLLAMNATDMIDLPDINTNIKTNKEPVMIENSYYNVTFCPYENCTKELNNILKNADNEIVCALYDLDLEEIKDTLEEKSESINVSILIDAHNNEDMDYNFVEVKDFYALMHNKFCVVDNQITFTGSFNPTVRGATKNNNNMLITNSTTLAENYHNYFDFLIETKDMNRGDLDYSFEHINYLYSEETSIKNYFCPWDDCAEHVIDELELAQNSIYFMTFSFTDDDIANTLLIKHYNGVDIKGVYEKTQNSQYSTYEILYNNSIPVEFDSNPYNMHHKVFIIDNRTVILGSYNPTNNGNKKNDENIIVITNKEIAREFLDEFDRVYYG